MKFWLVGGLIFLCSSSVVFGANINAGFVQGLWYSDATPIVTEPLRVYAAIRNHTGADLSGTIEFYVNDERIARKEVSALDGRIIEAWADWTPRYGEHTIRAELTRLELSSVDGTEATTEVVAVTAEDVIFVDNDTDQDGTGDEVDEDDDGDGITDEAERENGSDPLDPDSPAPPPELDIDSESTNDDTSPATSTVRGSANASAGLEQYLSPSRAQAILTTISDWSEEQKASLDTYRDQRGATVDDPTIPEPEISVDDDGFGEVTRGDARREPPRPTEGSDSVIGDIIATIGTAVSAIFSVILAALSYLLGHPMLIQLGLLLFLLWAVLRIARFFGKRPSD